MTSGSMLSFPAVVCSSVSQPLTCGTRLLSMCSVFCLCTEVPARGKAGEGCMFCVSCVCCAMTCLCNLAIPKYGLKVMWKRSSSCIPFSNWMVLDIHLLSSVVMVCMFVFAVAVLNHAMPCEPSRPWLGLVWLGEQACARVEKGAASKSSQTCTNSQRRPNTPLFL